MQCFVIARRAQESILEIVRTVSFFYSWPVCMFGWWSLARSVFLFFWCVLFVSRIINTPRLDLYVEKCCHWIQWYERFLYACAFCSLNELFYHTLGNRCLSRLTQQTSRCVANVKNKSLLTTGHIGLPASSDTLLRRFEHFIHKMAIIYKYNHCIEI